MNDHYELLKSPADMTVRLWKGGVQIAKCTEQEMAEHSQPGDTPEMAFARALAFRRGGQFALQEPEQFQLGQGEVA